MILAFFNNPFLSAEMSREDFLDLLGTSLHRMEGQNDGGRYDSLIAALRPHHDTYGTLLTRQRNFLLARHGEVRSVTEILADAATFATQDMYKEAAYHLGEGTPDYELLFPQGRTEYHRLTTTNAAQTLESLTDQVDALQARLGPKAAALLTRATALEDELDAAATTKGQKEGEVQGASTREKKLRAEACRQLKLNLLSQLTLHLDDDEQVKALYDPKFLNWNVNRGKKKADGEGETK